MRVTCGLQSNTWFTAEHAEARGPPIIALGLKEQIAEDAMDAKGAKVGTETAALPCHPERQRGICFVCLVAILR